MRRLLALICALAALPAPAAGTAQSFEVQLEPGKVHEECLRMEAGDKRRYHWKATAPVDFNIHFHKGNDVSYPVKRDAMRGDGGTFQAKTGEEYCWMWTARKAPAKIEGQILE